MQNNLCAKYLQKNLKEKKAFSQKPNSIQNQIIKNYENSLK